MEKSLRRGIRVIVWVFPTMSDGYSTLFTALGSAVIGGGVALVSSYLTNRANLKRLSIEHSYNSQREKSGLVRQRGEELYSLLHQWLNSYGDFTLRRSMAMQGKFTYQQCIDSDIAKGKELSYDFARIELLIDVYFPSGRAPYDALLRTRSELNEIETRFWQSYRLGRRNGSELLTPYVAGQVKFEDESETLKRIIRESIRGII